MSEEHIELYNLAIDAAQAGRLSEAISLVEESLLSAPSDQESWQLYTQLLAAAGRSTDAAKALDKLQSMGLSQARTLSIKASEALAKGDIALAINLLRQSLESDPDISQTHASLALILCQQNDFDSAITAAEQALHLDPAHPQANYVIGHILRLRGQSMRALASLTKAVEAEPAFTIALYEQGMAFADCGLLEDALAVFTKLIATMPDESNVRTAIACIKNRLAETRTL